MSVTPERGWNETLRDQLDFHYRHLFRRRLDGLTDEEEWSPEELGERPVSDKKVRKVRRAFVSSPTSEPSAS